MEMDALAICCETVELQKERGTFPIRVSVVNMNVRSVFDELIMVTDPVVSFNSNIHGISEQTLMENGIPFSKLRREVAQLIGGKIVVGYNLPLQLRVLLMDTDILRNNRRDTCGPKMFVTSTVLTNGSTVYEKPTLKALTLKHLGITIKGAVHGFHDTVEDAKAIMMLYKKFKDYPLDEWYTMP